jgi:Asp/Glu/hydantoin racemase
MRVKAITPIRVTDQELARRQRRYDAFAGGELRITVANLPDGPDTPRQLAVAADIEASDALTIAEARRTDPAEFDAVLPDCVLDPGVATLAGDAPLPVYGITRLAGGYLGSLGRPFAAVTRNPAIGEELVARVKHYGLEGAFAGLFVLDLAFEDIDDDRRWNAALDRVRDELDGQDVAGILNGCSAVDVRPAHGPPVVDPTRLALRLLRLGATEGLV